MLAKKKSSLEGENMQTQYSVPGYRIDLYFNDYKLAIEIDEKENIVRNIDYDKKQQNQNLAVGLLKLILIKKPLILLIV